jgi:hypothetical protein
MRRVAPPRPPATPPATRLLDDASALLVRPRDEPRTEPASAESAPALAALLPLPAELRLKLLVLLATESLLARDCSDST